MNIQKLIIKQQFMGVKPCEIELRRFLLLIGEQASGKSTIAKLIYFFQILPDVIYRSALLAKGKEESFDFTKHINLSTRNKFVDTFGPTTQNSIPFEIDFFYDEQSYITIYQGSDKLTYVEFEQKFGAALNGKIKNYFQASFPSDIEQILNRETLLKSVYSIFNQQNTKFNFIIAGRSSVVAYPDLIGDQVKNELEKLLEDEVRDQDFEKRKRRGNEMLFLEFVEWSEGIRKFFRENGGTFDLVIRNLALDKNIPLKEISNIASKILKGSYKSTYDGETIIPKGSKIPVAFKDASSGQQEVLRIIQGILIAVGSQNRREFLVVEEPEAHLFPLAQKELIHLFVLFLNTIKEGRLVITTHSPYILACVNILLMANLAAEQAQNGQLKKVNSIIKPEFWLNMIDFSAYALGQPEHYCTSISDKDTGLIDQNYLDLISEQLGLQFEALYGLLN